MIMEKCEGAADRNLLKADNGAGLSAEDRTRLFDRIADVLAEIHKVDVAGLALSDGAAADPARDQLLRYDQEIVRVQLEPMPELKLASLWLHAHLPPPPARLTLVHGDFRPANFLVADRAIRAVIDWEFAHVGDPAEDLGWYLTPYYAGEHLPEGRTAAQFLARYARASGNAIAPSTVRFWSVFALYKLASMSVTALHAAAAGDHSRLTASIDFILVPLLRAVAEPDPAPAHGDSK
jgi:aminoglycoside phosphotransferase (APT) family kinase protein